MDDIYIVIISLLYVWSYSGSLFTAKGIAKIYVKIVCVVWWFYLSQFHTIHPEVFI